MRFHDLLELQLKHQFADVKRECISLAQEIYAIPSEKEGILIK